VSRSFQFQDRKERTVVTVDPLHRRRHRRAHDRRGRLLAWLREQVGAHAPDDPEDVPAVTTPTRRILAVYALLGVIPSIVLAAGHGPLAWLGAAIVVACAFAGVVIVGGRVDGAVAALAVAADVDAVTGARSRAWADRHLRRALARVDLHRRAVIALLDLDHFKQVNDVHGHLAGDRALRAVARVLDEALRTDDWAARWGGDEFIVVIDARIDHALEALERVRRAVAAVRVAGVRDPISVSIGATLSRPGDELEDVLERADGALYAVKSGGGGGIRVSGDDE
jgi:diguanylate cyclase (GGDEF)-like protein